MEEKKVSGSCGLYQKIIKRILLICLFCFILSILVIVIGWNGSLLNLAQRLTNSNQYYPIVDTACYLAQGLFVPTIVLVVYYWYIAKMEIIVTNKRVYGKTSFGKQVDLPLDSISSVGMGMFQGIAVGTSSGRIKFIGISNRDEIYEAIKKILADRQSKEVKASAPVTNITQAQSSADEIKKFKELLDSGIITQEEFDAKKKQLLGL